MSAQTYVSVEEPLKLAADIRLISVLPYPVRHCRNVVVYIKALSVASELIYVARDRRHTRSRALHCRSRKPGRSLDSYQISTQAYSASVPPWKTIHF